jgi:hypothetical protein
MTASLDRFLGSKPVVQSPHALGRVFNVSRETWLLTDDPQRTPPAIERLISARTASEAADLAREIALEHPRHGFHKPSGAWWGADQQRFHRFVVHAGRRRSVARPLGVAILGVAVLALIGLSRQPKR